jgi:hypothetical protein
MGPVQPPTVDRLASNWFHILSALHAKPMCLFDSLLPKCPPHRSRWVAVPRSGLTASYVYRETRTVTYPSKGCTPDVQALRKASTEASNLSNNEIYFNFSLSISIQVFTTIGSAPKCTRPGTKQLPWSYPIEEGLG